MPDGIHYYPWYFNDWLGSGTRAEMKMEDRAIYRDLLDHQASQGDLPDSVSALANMALCSTGQMQAFLDRWGEVLFPRGEDGRRRNAKMAVARSAVLDSRERRSLAGQKGAEVRWGENHGNANSDANGIANGKRAFGFDSDSDSESPPRKRGGMGERKRTFSEAECERIYQRYPRKQAKRKALERIREALQRIAAGHDKPDWRADDWPPDDPVGWLEERVRAFADSPAGNAGKFVPIPTTWFHQARYCDDEQEWQRRGDDGQERSAARIQAPKGKYDGIGEELKPEQA